MNELLYGTKSIITLQHLLKKQLVASIDLYKFTVNNAIYASFALNDCKNCTVELKNGLVLEFLDFNTNNESIKFEVTAGDKQIISGAILKLFDNDKDSPIFAYEGKLFYSIEMTVTELESARNKWEMLANLISPNTIY